MSGVKDISLPGVVDGRQGDILFRAFWGRMMARPRKNTVEYFPHICKSGKTISILEKKFGNDGYACWFKILEFLGDSEGHSYDCSDEYNWEYLKAKTLINEDERLTEIIDLLATVRAIDKDLWSQDKVLWSDNFLIGLTSVYQKRTTEMPGKPSLRNEKQLPAEFSGRKPHKGSKGKEVKENNMSSTLDVVDDVFSYWQEVHKHPRSKLDDKRKKKIKSRLENGYTVQEIKDAIDGCKLSPHHMGKNENGTIYDDIELICRDAAHVDSFRKLKEQENKKRFEL